MDAYQHQSLRAVTATLSQLYCLPIVAFQIKCHACFNSSTCTIVHDFYGIPKTECQTLNMCCHIISFKSLIV